MTVGEMLVLALVLITVLGFSATLAWVSRDSRND